MIIDLSIFRIHRKIANKQPHLAYFPHVLQGSAERSLCAFAKFLVSEAEYSDCRRRAWIDGSVSSIKVLFPLNGPLRVKFQSHR